MITLHYTSAEEVHLKSETITRITRYLLEESLMEVHCDEKCHIVQETAEEIQELMEKDGVKFHIVERKFEKIKVRGCPF